MSVNNLSLAKFLAHFSAKLSRKLSLGAGTTIGGRIASLINPNLLTTLCANKNILLVTGTNGKTTTAYALNSILKAMGFNPVTNMGGSNMIYGILYALLTQESFNWAVLEIDELWLTKLIHEIAPKVVVITNLSRDQLDRVNEVRQLASKINQSLKQFLSSDKGKDALVVANADDPIVVYALKDLFFSVKFISIGIKWRQDAYSCPECAGLIEFNSNGFVCDNCGFKSPQTYGLLEGNVLTCKDFVVEITTNIPGQFNLGNFALSIVAAFFCGVNSDFATKALSEVSSVYGRYEIFNIRSRKVQLILAKNPAGFYEALGLVNPGEEVLLGLNAEIPDGKDTSWIWDVDFSSLKDNTVIITGKRVYDLALVLSYQGVSFSLEKDLKQAFSNFKNPSGSPVKAILNYSLFLESLKLFKK